jgi:DNA recombination protein RmuC
MLKGIAYGWKQERLAENADELRRIASEFYDRMRAFAALHAESGRSLGKAVEAYNKSVASWDARLKPSLKRMRELGAGGAADVPDLPSIEQTVRENANSAAAALEVLKAKTS